MIRMYRYLFCRLYLFILNNKKVMSGLLNDDEYFLAKYLFNVIELVSILLFHKCLLMCGLNVSYAFPILFSLVVWLINTKMFGDEAIIKGTFMEVLDKYRDRLPYILFSIIFFFSPALLIVVMFLISKHVNS